MIAKLIAHGESRAEALERLTEALDATVAEGVTTNLPFLRWLVRHPAFVAAEPLDRLPLGPAAALGAAAAAPAGPVRGSLAAQPAGAAAPSGARPRHGGTGTRDGGRR